MTQKTDSEIKEIVEKIIFSIKPEINFLPDKIDSLSFDDIDMIEFILECENHLSVCIDDEVFKSFTQCQEIIDYLESLQRTS